MNPQDAAKCSPPSLGGVSAFSEPTGDPRALAAYEKTEPPEVLESGQQAASEFLAQLDRYPADTGRCAMEIQAHAVLGWIAHSRRDASSAEREFRRVVTLDPSHAAAYRLLGQSIIRQQNVARYSEAVFFVARAVIITGAGALPPDVLASCILTPRALPRSPMWPQPPPAMPHFDQMSPVVRADKPLMPPSTHR